MFSRSAAVSHSPVNNIVFGAVRKNLRFIALGLLILPSASVRGHEAQVEKTPTPSPALTNLINPGMQVIRERVDIINTRVYMAAALATRPERLKDDLVELNKLLVKRELDGAETLSAGLLKNQDIRIRTKALWTLGIAAAVALSTTMLTRRSIALSKAGLVVVLASGYMVGALGAHYVTYTAMSWPWGILGLLVFGSIHRATTYGRYDFEKQSDNEESARRSGKIKITVIRNRRGNVSDVRGPIIDV